MTSRLQVPREKCVIIIKAGVPYYNPCGHMRPYKARGLASRSSRSHGLSIIRAHSQVVSMHR
jgi:hypothetical protein